MEPYISMRAWSQVVEATSRRSYASRGLGASQGYPGTPHPNEAYSQNLKDNSCDGVDCGLECRVRAVVDGAEDAPDFEVCDGSFDGSSNVVDALVVLFFRFG